MSSQVKKFSQCELRGKKHQYFSTVSLPTDSVIVDHAVLLLSNSPADLRTIKQVSNRISLGNVSYYHVGVFTPGLLGRK
jgi:hypothetical protein